ncbi:hypothetical protein K432DRAFT_348029 [Lepidopterella palustris CBS 459.81]|uniref:Phospholipid/glycerol acyltransferase domain-containing protein n=1 Tax=Lepidopterella palustris CBS 459.81 TaxID=1314670 RepID=A0A8E2JHP2_9PEZI|nr:hypothetical protein K432DRAFT_348029 [Lepidopterella palustris CBS 459.81]
MEKYSQFRDRGTAIAPFFPVPSPPSGLLFLPVHIFLFALRVPPLLCVSIFYFLILRWLPVGSLFKKAALWCMIGIPGIWWIDLQIDRVKRGSLAKQNAHRLPAPGTIIASSFTSPLDCLYLAAIFDPVFTASYPNSRKVQRISLFRAMQLALLPPTMHPPPSARLTTLSALLAANPDACIVVLPECTTTNGRAILPFSQSLLTAPPTTKIFPLNLRYTPGDITTPIPGTYLSWIWKLNSKPTHCIRVRIAECVYNNASLTSPLPSTTSTTLKPPQPKTTYETNFFDTMNIGGYLSSSETLVGSDETASSVNGAGEDGLSSDERRVLDRVAEDLARLGRVKRVGLGVRDKIEFVKIWSKRKR